jgi:putative ABC transport system permease protein
MVALYRSVVLRHLRRDWGKGLLAVIGVAIGVSVFVAIRLANTTIFSAFTSSLDEVAGRANLQVVANDGLGFDERLLGRLRSVRAVRAAAPVVEQYAEVYDRWDSSSVKGGTPILLFGVDVFSEGSFRVYSSNVDPSQSQRDSTAALRFLLEPDAVIITSKLAGEYHLARGDTLRLVANGERIPLRVVDIIVPRGTASVLGGNFALIDIASLQETFRRLGRIDRIDLLVDDTDRSSIREYLGSTLPANVVVRDPASRGGQVTQMLASFDLNLTALAFIALFVAMFIIYNTTLTSTLRRRRELGILRSLGASRSTIIWLILAEAGTIGVIGSAVGVVLGIGLAQLALEQVSRTVTALYLLTVVDDITISSVTLLVGAGLGIIVSLVSALPVAVEASRASPRETFAVESLEKKVRLRIGAILLVTTICILAALAAAWLGDKLLSPLLGFISAGLLLLGIAFLTPIFVRLASRIFGGTLRSIFGVEGELANAWLVSSLGRTSTAIAALMTAIAMLISISTMVDSFRRTVEYWMRGTINADLYLTASSNRISGSTQFPLPNEVVGYMDSLPGVAHADALRRTRVGYRGATVTVSGSRFNVPEGISSLSFIGTPWNEAMAHLAQGEVAVSEGFAMRFEKSLGDTIKVSTTTGAKSFTIGGIYYDYSSDGGTVMMRKDLFASAFADSTTNSMALYLRDPSEMESTRRTIERRFSGKYSLLVYSNRSLRDDALLVFDQTFAITYALQLVAIIVAAFGVANTLAALVVERRREIAIIRAIGGSSAQVRKMTLVQAGLIGLASQGLGVGAGLLLSMILIYVINRVSFGWTIQMTISPSLIGVSALLVLATSLLAGIIPANKAGKIINNY